MTDERHDPVVGRVEFGPAAEPVRGIPDFAGDGPGDIVTNSVAPTVVCTHGRLARSCEHCEIALLEADLTAANARAEDAAVETLKALAQADGATAEAMALRAALSLRHKSACCVWHGEDGSDCECGVCGRQREALATPGPGATFLAKHREIVGAAREVLSRIWPRLPGLTQFDGKPATRLRALLDGEEAALLEACEDDLAQAVRLALHTGLRVSEQLGVRRDDVDVEAATIRLTATKNGRSRLVRLNTAAAAVVRAQLAAHDSEWLYPAPRDAGRPLGRRTLAHRWEQARSDAGLDALHWHDLRATCATRMLEEGATVEEVRDQLGHTSLGTISRYARLVDGRQREAVERLVRRERRNRRKKRGSDR